MKPTHICSFPDCERPRTGTQDLCRAHYEQRWHGKPLKPLRDWHAPEHIRFMRKVRKGCGGACWVWTASMMPNGYGKFGVRRPDGKWVPVLAHRWSYEYHVGPIPDGLVIDHLCRNRACVNPDHLEPVTQRTNVLRGEAISAHCAVKTHCDHGHEFTPENTYAWRGKRYCRTCRRINDQNRPSRRRSA